MNFSHQTDEETTTHNLTQLENSLIIYNDNVNTFEWVIETLIDICKHTEQQAEQCAFIIHYKGKYAVKHGNFEGLKPMKDQIVERGINATIQ